MRGFGILLFVVFILLSIGVHEFGHFATARLFGIKVDRFYIGFGPRLWSRRRGDTEFVLAALPLGGFVRIAGMSRHEDVPPEDRARTFRSKPTWQRAIVLATGSLTHFAIAFGILLVILVGVGRPDRDRPTLEIGRIAAEYKGSRTPAAEAGLRKGDVFVAIDGVRVGTWTEAVAVIRERPGKSVAVEVARDGERLTLPADLGREIDEGKTIGFLGVVSRLERVREPVLAGVRETAKIVGVGAKDSLLAFGRIFSPDTLSRLWRVAIGTEERSIDDPATIVGVGREAGNLARQGDFVALFLLVAGFNVFVGVANLLPLPPLDGGHLAVLGYEKLRRREVDMRRLLPVTAVVVAAFASLFLLLLYLDVVSPLPALGG